MILCWAAFTAILGCMWPLGCGLDAPGKEGCSSCLEHNSGHLGEWVHFSVPNKRTGTVTHASPPIPSVQDGLTKSHNDLILLLFEEQKIYLYINCFLPLKLVFKFSKLRSFFKQLYLLKCTWPVGRIPESSGGITRELSKMTKASPDQLGLWKVRLWGLFSNSLSGSNVQRLGTSALVHGMQEHGQQLSPADQRVLFMRRWEPWEWPFPLGAQSIDPEPASLGHLFWKYRILGPTQDLLGQHLHEIRSKSDSWELYSLEGTVPDAFQCLLLLPVYCSLLWAELYPPKFICWSPNPQYLRVWPNLEIGYL